jgi:acyl-CoA reductase-like NAD-dependent aldehyde dehydrogenase
MRITRRHLLSSPASRVLPPLLHRDIFDHFLNALGQNVKAIKLDDPLDETSDIGAIINEKQFRKVCGYVEEGLKRREARLVKRSSESNPLSEGYCAIPIIFVNVTNDWRLDLCTRACRRSLDRRGGCDLRGE